ncbi:fibroblast growth factor receptor 4-like [Oscarella lobularis]|uniref:fibroblast growth factor receptor 4-like n=1 Tax=Oscarella lobularis TaxID=121494 RepID=UPI00331335C0
MGRLALRGDAVLVSILILYVATSQCTGELKITNGDYFDKVERVNLEKDSLKTMMTIRCEAIGAEEIRWSKDAQQLKSKRKSINTRILKIRLFINIDKKQQVGLAGYNCTAINGSTSVSAVKKVQFYRELFSEWRNVVQATYNTTVKIQCRPVRSLSKIEWHRVRLDDIYNASAPPRVITWEKTLVIKHVRGTDAGVYSCKAKSSPGEINIPHAEVELIVKDIPFPPSFMGHNVSHLSIIEMNREDVAESECVVSSSERNWTINWYQDKDETTPLAEIDVVAVSPPSKPAQSSLTKLGTTYSRTLYVPGAPENEGNYECKVESSLHKRAGVARTVNVTYSAPPTEALAKGTTPESWKSTTTTPTAAPTPSAFLLSTSSKAKSWIAAVVLAALFAVVLVVLALAYRRRQRAKRHAYEFQTVSVETKVALARRPSTIASSPVDKKAVKLSSMEFPRGKITLGDVLGNGHFGVVMAAEAESIIPGQTRTTVAIKTVRDESDSKAIVDLASEANLMTKVGTHENVLGLLGICSKDGPLWLIMEYARYGNLRDFLRSKRRHRGVGHTDSTDSRLSTISYKSTLTYSSSLNPISERDMLYYGKQIATGMEYLIDKQCVHRDLAARNVLVCDDDVLKIADFGMAKDIHYFEYYRKKSKGAVPVRWTAPEALLYKVYTEASDIWSYGIVLWEIATLGGTPHPGIPVERLFSLFASSDYKMSRPRGCPQKLYEIMKECWEIQAEERPRFSQIRQRFENILEEFPEIPPYQHDSNVLGEIFREEKMHDDNVEDFDVKSKVLKEAPST